jgi:hypothetical protein
MCACLKVLAGAGATKNSLHKLTLERIIKKSKLFGKFRKLTFTKSRAYGTYFGNLLYTLSLEA